MQKRPSSSIQKIHHRPGEGHAVDLTIVSTDKGSVTGTLDLSGLPVPDRRFACDAVGIRIDEQQVKLLFAQKQPIGEGLLSMLVINMAPEAVVQFLSSVHERFTSDYSEFSKHFPPGKITAFEQNAQQSVVLTSSMVMAGYNGSNGCLDFYYASPFSVQQLATVRKLSLEPVVRVNAPTSHLFVLIDALRDGADKNDWGKVLQSGS